MTRFIEGKLILRNHENDDNNNDRKYKDSSLPVPLALINSYVKSQTVL